MNKEAFNHYRLQLPDIDGQHWRLFLTLDEIRVCNTVPEFLDAVDRLCELWKSHIDYEQELMARCNYPYIEYHVADHAVLLAAFENILRYSNLVKLQYNISQHISDLETAFRNHIDQHDIQYVSYVKEAFGGSS